MTSGANCSTPPRPRPSVPSSRPSSRSTPSTSSTRAATPKKFQELDTAGRINWREGAGQISVLARDVTDAIALVNNTFFAYFQSAINMTAQANRGRFDMSKFPVIQGVQRVGQVQVNATTPVID